MHDKPTPALIARRAVERWFFRKTMLLVTGLILMVVSDMPGSAGIFAWVFPIPFLIFVSYYRGIGEHGWLLLSLVAGGVLTLLKAASVPLVFSVPFALLSGTVTGFRYFLAFALWGWIRGRTGDRLALVAFPAVIVTLEYLQATFTPLGVWGDLANTQVSNLAFLQGASLFGSLGLSAVMAWGAVLVAMIVIRRGLAGSARAVVAFVLVTAGLLVFGDLRLDTVPAGPQVLTAALTSDYRFTGELPNPDDPVVQRTTESLLERTAKAADAGASMVAWGEGSTLVDADGEARLLSRLSNLARAGSVQIVAAYVVLPASGQVHGFQNKFTWIGSDGTVLETYLKHHPVPGEGSLRGTAELRVIPTELGNLAGAICYDYDFPRTAFAHARKGADLVVLPGLDWRGMLRRHSLMARIRAIEGGFSLLRPANGATSMAFDSYGQIRASMTDFGDNDKILLASLPVDGHRTLYSRVGNVLAYAAMVVLALCVGAAAGVARLNRKSEER